MFAGWKGVKTWLHDFIYVSQNICIWSIHLWQVKTVLLIGWHPQFHFTVMICTLRPWSNSGNQFGVHVIVQVIWGKRPREYRISSSPYSLLKAKVAFSIVVSSVPSSWAMLSTFLLLIVISNISYVSTEFLKKTVISKSH